MTNKDAVIKILKPGKQTNLILYSKTCQNPKRNNDPVVIA